MSTTITPNANAYTTASQKERFFFDKLHSTHKVMKTYYLTICPAVDIISGSGYDNFDFILSKFEKDYSLTEQILIEMKVRTMSSTTYPDFVLEKKKYDDLKFYQNYLHTKFNCTGKTRIMYINYFAGDNKYLLWDLDRFDVTPYYELKVMNKATMTSTTNKTTKEIYNLPSSLAMSI